MFDDNTSASALYRKLGFTRRRSITVTVLRRRADPLQRSCVPGSLEVPRDQSIDGTDRLSSATRPTSHPCLSSHAIVWSSNMPANNTLTTAHGLSRSARPSSSRPIALSTHRSYTATVNRRTSCGIAADFLLHHVARSAIGERWRQRFVVPVLNPFPVAASRGELRRQKCLSQPRSPACSCQPPAMAQLWPVVSWALRASDAANWVVSAVMAYFTAKTTAFRNAESKKRFGGNLGGERD